MALMDLKGSKGVHYAQALLPLVSRVRGRLISKWGLSEKDWSSCLVFQGDGEDNLENAVLIVAPQARYLQCNVHAIRQLILGHVAQALNHDDFGAQTRNSCRGLMKALFLELMESSSEDEFFVRSEHYLLLFVDEDVPLNSDDFVNTWFDSKIIPAITKDLEAADPNISSAKLTQAINTTVKEVISTLGNIFQYFKRELVPRGRKLCKFAFDEISPEAWEKHNQSNLVEAHNYNILRVIPNLSRVTSFAALLQPLTGIIVASNNLFFFRQLAVLTDGLRRKTRTVQEEEKEKQLIANALEVDVKIPDLSLAKSLQRARRRDNRGTAFAVNWAEKYIAHLVALEAEDAEVHEFGTQNARVQFDVEQEEFVSMGNRSVSSAPPTASNTEKSLSLSVT